MSADLYRRLSRLEAKHKRVLRCLLCRYSLRDTSPKRRERYDAQPASVLPTKCWHCGTQFIIPLPRSDERYRQAADLHYNSHPTKHFTDERVHAAGLWLELSVSQKDKYEKGQREKAERASRPKAPRPAGPPMRGPLTLKERKEKEAREELRQRAIEFHRARLEYFKRRARGPESFPLDETIEALDEEEVHAYSKSMEQEVEALGLEKYGEAINYYRSQTVTIKNSILTLRKRGACEVVIWGGAQPDTLEEIAFFETLLPEVAAGAKVKDREEKERKAREAVERQRQHDEYLARTRGGTQQSSTGQYKGANPEPRPGPEESRPNPSDVLKHLMGETAYNAMRAAEDFASNSRPTDARGRRSIEIPYIPQEQAPHPPPDDGTLRYQQKLAHWKRTGVWLPDEWM